MQCDLSKAENYDHVVLRSCTICPSTKCNWPPEVVPRHTVRATMFSRRDSCCLRSLKQLNGGARRTTNLRARRSCEHNRCRYAIVSQAPVMGTVESWQRHQMHLVEKCRGTDPRPLHHPSNSMGDGAQV